MKFIVFALIPLILSIGIVPVLPLNDAFALKSKGNSLPEVGSNKVCGDRLCSEIVVPANSQKSSIQKHPNIIFILTDNQAQAALGVYGNLDVKTPNIDRLASEGILFNNVFAANGMCSPTRATLMTGLLPSQHGVHNWLDDHNLEDWPEN